MYVVMARFELGSGKKPPVRALIRVELARAAQLCGALLEHEVIVVEESGIAFGVFIQAMSRAHAELQAAMMLTLLAHELPELAGSTLVVSSQVE